jgi:hypothetical protein
LILIELGFEKCLDCIRYSKKCFKRNKTKKNNVKEKSVQGDEKDKLVPSDENIINYTIENLLNPEIQINSNSDNSNEATTSNNIKNIHEISNGVNSGSE